MRIRAAGAALLSMALLLATTGPAAAESAPRVAAGPDGTAHVAWTQHLDGHPVAKLRIRGTDGSLGDTEYLTPGDETANDVDIAVGPTGRTITAWETGPYGSAVVKLRRRSPDGSLSPVQTLSGPGADSVAVELDADGDAIVMWTRGVNGKAVLETRRRAADGSLSAVKRLSASSPSYSVYEPQLAVAPDGTAVYTWTVLAPTRYVQARRRAPDGTLSPVQNLTSGAAATTPHVALHPGGEATFAWTRAKAEGDVVQVRRRSAGGALSAIRDVSAPASNVAGAPQVAVAPDGSALIGYHRAVAPYPFEVRRLSPGGTLGQVETVSPNGAWTEGGRIGVDADGDALLAWRTRGEGYDSHVQARRRTPAGAYGPIDDITPVAAGTATFPEFSLEPGGGATFAWLRLTPDDHAVVEARRRAPAGELSAIDQLTD